MKRSKKKNIRKTTEILMEQEKGKRSKNKKTMHGRPFVNGTEYLHEYRTYWTKL